jgi:alkanesulfonate monooxygenase SsuD/methylene tetrahydromethanopterin reductase-like flavin-dependent oxidoreductase (luciferase family)
MFVITFVGVIGPDEDFIEHAINDTALKWAAASLIPGPQAFTRYGYESPLGNWSYARDLVTTDWSREDTLAIAEKVPPEMVRNVHITGTPPQAAAQMQAYVEAGCTHLLVGNMGGLVTSGNWSEAGGVRNVMFETFDEMRKLNGQALPAGVPT